ncbi:DUF5681 domain-containing protein [uncultured Ruegeria sp.]|uniref:DUF5681 domain-containing protein n=1 Tax=uncultured Ruegeria sp. TaxID=259304 RepID=UPI00262CCAAA|nr:DUF5681 domain-containing protein [uncultured Ruegeria sp.]
MSDKGYNVGYGRPPRETQFQKGQSGNPKGRPRKKGTVELDLDQVLDQRVRVQSPGGSKSMDTREAALRMQVAKALKGNIHAAKHVLKQFEKYDAITPPRSKIQTGVVIAPRASFKKPERDS